MDETPNPEQIREAARAANPDAKQEDIEEGLPVLP